MTKMLIVQNNNNCLIYETSLCYWQNQPGDDGGCISGGEEDGPSAQPLLSAVYDADEEQHGEQQRH